MLSFDVKSLFTNVAIKRSISCLERKFREFNLSDVEVNELISMSKICGEQTAFLVDGMFYKQTDELVMGNYLTPILCKIYMHYFEEKLLTKFKFDCWLMYVDNTFVLVNNDCNSSDLHLLINSIDPCIQFTLEEARNDYLPFLDVSV